MPLDLSDMATFFYYIAPLSIWQFCFDLYKYPCFGSRAWSCCQLMLVVQYIKKLASTPQNIAKSVYYLWDSNAFVSKEAYFCCSTEGLSFLSSILQPIISLEWGKRNRELANKYLGHEEDARSSFLIQFTWNRF